MKQKYIRSLQNVLISFMFILILLMNVLLGVFNYRNARELTEDYVDIYMQQTVQGVTEQVDMVLNEIDSLIVRFVNSSTVQNYIHADIKRGPRELSKQESYVEQTTIEKYVSDLHPNWNYVQFMGIYFNDKYYYYGTVGRPEFYPDIREQIEPQMTADNMKPINLMIRAQNRQLLAIVRPITDFETQKLICWLVIGINLTSFSQLLNEGTLGETGKLQLIDRDYNLIYSSEQEDQEWYTLKEKIVEKRGSRSLPNGFYTDTIDKMQYVSQSTSSNDWFVVGYVPFNEMMQGFLNWNTVLLIPILSILGGLFFCVIIAHRISRPISRIVVAMQAVSEDDYSIRICDHSFKETEYICEHFNNMMDHIGRLITEVHKAELERKDAEFAALKAQIRPHFIYNTLENINMMLIMREQTDISELVTIFADILRYNINPQKEEVLLEEDMEQIKKYLRLQQIRFGNRLQCSIEMTDSARRLRILKLLIQPLVENAVIHGIENLPAGGRIDVRAYTVDEKLYIAVRDNGVGFSQGEENFLEDEHKSGQGHLGLANVYNRIQHYYGKEYGIRIKKKKKGACVVIVLPAKEDE